MLASLVAMTAGDRGPTGTLFLDDPATGELYSRVDAQSTVRARSASCNDAGIAGQVFNTGERLIVDDAYADPRFNRESTSRPAT